MTRFRYYVAASVDGYIADEQESLDWLTAFDSTEGIEEAIGAFMDQVGAVVMGADTYTWLVRHSPHEWPYGHLPAWVFTHRELPGVPEADITFVRGEPAEWVPDIREAAGERDVWVLGGGSLAGQLVEAGCLDELILTTVPVVLGGGRRLFATRGEVRLMLTQRRSFADGVVEDTYDVVAPPAADPGE
ncbi:dihydrofolate reductase family protein [Zhihengliuella flava]|uniref:Dihydrofolate reductase n=1 Tax=Zhihengliuella flava TaxID=1285193 RepID=A0A931DDU2_9MICC|nr:dihydrofolate reductase family protein [Zhihengliuella flava]MBG6085741.1 dihydrofolate reductase [Zhihengliuella flava]